MVLEENRNRQEVKNREFSARFEALEESLRNLREEISSLRKVQEEGLRKVFSAFQEFLAAAMGD
jgi:galactokinase